MNQEFNFKKAQHSKNLKTKWSYKFQVLNLKLGIALRVSVPSANHPHGQENHTQKYINMVLFTVWWLLIKISELSRRVSSLLEESSCDFEECHMKIVKNPSL